MSAAFVPPNGAGGAPARGRHRRWAALILAGAATIGHGAAWCQPGAPYLHSSIYDPVRQRMVVFGGWDGIRVTNGTWQLTLDRDPRWDPLLPAGVLPAKRVGHSAIYDPVRDRMLVFGGLDSSGSVLDTVWSLSLADPPTWSPLEPSGTAPPGRRYHTAIYDPVRDRMLVFGGLTNGGGNPDTTVWSLWLTPSAMWEKMGTRLNASPGRWGHSAIYDPPRDRMLVFGGYPGFNDTRALGLGTMTWIPLGTSGSRPSARWAHSAIYDPTADRMTVFGGYDGNNSLNDVWQLSLTVPRWSPLEVQGNVPTIRSYHSAVCDTFYRRMVVFGGSPSPSEPTWALPLGDASQWSPFRPVVQVSETELQIPTVTIGDTASVPFVISNLGLKPLHIDEVLLPAPPPALPPEMMLSAPAPLDLAWGESVSEILFLAASRPWPPQDSLVISSNDPFVPRRQVNLTIDVRGLDFEARVLGGPVAPLGTPLLVVATPEPGVRVERAALHYRIASGGSAFNSRAFTPLSTDFIAAIPASDVTEHGVEFYVEIENSGFTATQPPGAPAAVFTQEVAAPESFTAVPRPTAGPDFLAGDSIEVEIVLPDGTVFRSGKIHYRQGGEQGYQSDTLTVGVLGRPVGIIPGGVVSPYGVEYWVEVTTLKDTLRFPSLGTPPERIRVKVQDLAEATQHPAARYRLLSVPLDFGNFSGSLDALLTDQLGTYDPVRWRAYSYDPDLGDNIEFSAAEAARFQPEPGRAFWLISREAHRVDTKPIDGYSTRTGGRYPVALKEGWNQFGNPFDFRVAWGDVDRDPIAVSDLVAFVPSLGTIGDYAAEVPSVLEPFEGYFVYSTQVETLWVSPRAAPTPARKPATQETALAASSPPAPRESQRNLWAFNVRAWTDQSVDASNWLGLDAAAAQGFDRLDWPKPPPPPGPSWVQVAFVHPEWQERAGRYRRDLRGPGAEGETWEIEVRSSTPGDPVTLELAELAAPLPELTLRLIDREQGSSVEWRRGTAGDTGEGLRYRVISLGSHPYRLAIVAGTEPYVERAARQALTIPARTTLDPNAPNPFRVATRIRFGLPRAERVSLEIYSVLGQRVAAPLDHASLAPGYHSLVWDGTMTGGGRAPSGIYLIRLIVGGEALTKRLVVVR